MNFEDIIFDKQDGAARITINRPDKMNSFRNRTLLELREALGDAAADSGVGVIAITGAGGRAFCAGGDVAEMLALDRARGREFLNTFSNLFQQVRRAPQPVIAAVDGYCLGGGNEINMVCDLTLATEKSVFGQVGPTVGSIPVLAGTQYLPRCVGDKRAKEIIFLCQRYSAREAMEMGWVNKVVADGTLAAELQAWIDRILSMSPQALRIAKLSLNFEGDLLYPSFTHGIELLSMTYGSEEFQEGMNSFLEKRKPDFMKFRK
ncbi:MAG TPA: enoyl-CoA hydratase-related protein [bacterium]|nr:enoyl-CoA hydratase-related protein [bacterium]